MPSNVVKTKADEKKWDKAQELAAEAGHKEDWAYVMGIYKKMKPDHFKQGADSLPGEAGMDSRNEADDELQAGIREEVEEEGSSPELAKARAKLNLNEDEKFYKNKKQDALTEKLSARHLARRYLRGKDASFINNPDSLPEVGSTVTALDLPEEGGHPAFLRTSDGREMWFHVDVKPVDEVDQTDMADMDHPAEALAFKYAAKATRWKVYIFSNKPNAKPLWAKEFTAVKGKEQHKALGLVKPHLDKFEDAEDWVVEEVKDKKSGGASSDRPFDLKTAYLDMFNNKSGPPNPEETHILVLIMERGGYADNRQNSRSQVMQHMDKRGFVHIVRNKWQVKPEFQRYAWAAVNRAQQNKKATNQTVIESPHNHHPVKLEPPQAKRKVFPFEGYIDFQGIKIDVENKKGSVRRGEGPEGKWETKMYSHYGEIRGTKGTDGDKLDAYVGSNHDSSIVVVVHQHNPWDGKFDEDKVMLGYNSIEEAIGAYKVQYDRPGFYKEGEHTAMPIGQFWRWVTDTRKKGKKVTGGMFQAPPALVKAVSDWVLSIQAAGSRDPVWEKYNIPGTKRLAGRPKIQWFKMDLTGWRYAQIAGKRLPREWRKVKVKVQFKRGGRGGDGSWDPIKRELTIRFDFPPKPPHSLKETVRHELEHMAQDMLSDLKEAESPAPRPGLPSRHVLTPGHSQALNLYDTGMTFEENYLLDDVEFYPQLRDMLEKASRQIAIDPTRRDEVLSDAMQGKTRAFLPMEIWKRLAPGKWKKAVKEFARAFPRVSTEKGKKAAGTVMFPAHMLKSGTTEYATAGWWKEFNPSGLSERAWAKTVEFTEPIDVSVHSDGSVLFSDGHHRAMAGKILGIHVPVRITRNKLKPDVWRAFLGLVRKGVTLKEINPEGYNLNSSVIPSYETVVAGRRSGLREEDLTQFYMDRETSGRVALFLPDVNDSRRTWTHIGGDLEASFDGEIYVDVRVKDTTDNMFFSRHALAGALALFTKGAKTAGTWGVGPFASDHALDFMGYQVKNVIEEALNSENEMGSEGRGLVRLAIEMIIMFEGRGVRDEHIYRALAELEKMDWDSEWLKSWKNPAEIRAEVKRQTDALKSLLARWESNRNSREEKTAAGMSNILDANAVRQLKQDMRRLTKIYKSVPTSSRLDYSLGDRIYDDPKWEKKWEDARKIIATFRKNLEAWVYKVLIPTATGKEDKTWTQRQLRDKAWTFLIDLSHHEMFPTQWDSRTNKNEKAPWVLDKKRATNIRRYQKSYRAFIEALEEMVQYEGSDGTLERPEEFYKTQLAGMNVVIHTKGMEDRDNEHEAFLKDLRRQAQQIQQAGFAKGLKGLTLHLSYDRNDLTAGQYDWSKDELYVFPLGMIQGKTADVFIHEVGHRFYFKALPGRARSHWEQVINGRGVKIEKADVERYMNLYQTVKYPDRKSLTQMAERAKVDPETRAKFKYLADHDPSYTRSLEEVRQHHMEFSVGDDVQLEKTTDYGATNPIEAFAEAFQLYVRFGPRKLGPWTRHFFEMMTRSGRTAAPHPRHKVWFHGSRSFTGALKPMWLSARSDLAEMHGPVFAFEVDRRAEWFNLDEPRETGPKVGSTMESIGYDAGDTKQLRDAGYDVVWSHREGGQQVYILNPRVLKQNKPTKLVAGLFDDVFDGAGPN